MQQHYFIGINIPPTFKDTVEMFKQKYQLETAYKVIPHVEDLHVTLLYVGTVPDEQLPLVKTALLEIAACHSTFPMHVDGLSYFGASSGPRVVYLSVEESVALSSLQREIEHIVAKQLDRPISERFTPHVTIAKKRKTTDDLVIQKEKVQPIEVRVLSFSLFVIHPDKSPKYQAIETFELS
ncbi:RNA 2',3'-cyclic phosphodiesterase [Sporosarcina sp. YIM B06819]|uniref:RNA 2',3'-cyclic phosphodiesterase n=1 Tax=Sporosarcina sp. YIM B06819 TaxID=3081769 RepID=UPI00298CF72A|nr:RNA 2',3'-cyclic phosphodiesterase [Sporosarcina sp. YIM B06819]